MIRVLWFVAGFVAGAFGFLAWSMHGIARVIEAQERDGR